MKRTRTKRWALVTASALSLCVAKPAISEEDAPFPRERLVAAEAVVEAEARRLLEAGTASVSVGLLFGDEVVWARAYGYANVYTQSPAGAQTLYNAASTIKPLTATAVLQLVENGDLALDEPVETYLPEFLFHDADGHPVLVRQLLEHTSALSTTTRMIDLWSREAPDSLEEIAARLEVGLHPGERFEYNNAAFAVAGLLVERRTGMGFEEYLQAKILAPLGISGSPVYPTPAMVERLALPYRAGEDGRSSPVAQKRVDVYPAGDLYLTATDMARFVCIHVNAGSCNGATVLAPESVSRMHQRGLGDYGLGWGILPEGERFLIGHGGGIPGYSAFVLGDPGERLAVAAMATSGDLSRLARAALVVLRGEEWVPPESRPVFEVAPEILAEYVGSYEIQPGVLVRIGLDADGLYAEDPSGHRLDLRAASESTFFLLETEGTLSFLRVDGEVSALDMNPGGTARRVD